MSCPISAQESKIDSLKNLLPTVKDTTYIKALIDLCWNYRSVQLDSAEKYGKQAYTLAQRGKHTYLFALSMHYLGVVSLSRGNTAQALDYYFKVAELAEKNNYTERLAYVYHDIGRVNELQKNYEQAITYVNRSISIFEKLNNQLGLSYCYLTLGEIFRGQKKFNESLAYYEKSLLIRQKLNNQSGIAAIYSIMGKSYQIQLKYKEATNYLEKAYNIFSNANDTRGIVTALNRLAQIYIIQKNWEQALLYSEKSIKLARQTGITEVLKESYKNLIDIYVAKNDYVKAYQYESQLNSYKDSVLDQERERKAQEIEAKYMSTRREQDIALLRKENQNQLSFIYLSVTVFVLMVIVGVILYFNIRQNTKKNQQLLMQQKEIQEKNNALIALNEEVTIKNHEITAQRDEQEKINIFKDKLFSIISHDLRSPLASLQNSLFLFKSDILTPQEKETLIDLLLRDHQATSYLLDNLLNWTRMQMQGLKINPTQLKLADIIEENFELLMPQAEKKSISLVCNISTHIVVFSDLEMIKTVVRNLIHNAIKYTPPNGTVRVNSFTTTDYIITAIQDSGRGMSAEEQKKLFSPEHFSKFGTANEKGSGLGLLLCKDFIEKNGGTIWVESIENEGSTFSFTLPTNPVKKQ